MARISVYLADKQVLFREGIHFTLSGEEDIEVIGETTSNEEALSFIESNPPAVAILNINHGKPSGMEITRRIKQDLPIVSVILVMDSPDEELMFSAIKSGASACITKDIDPDSLLKHIRDVTGDRKPICRELSKPGMALRVLEEFEKTVSGNSHVSKLLSHLTPREGDILRRLSQGESCQQVAAGMNLGEETIDAYLAMTLTKLACNEHYLELIATTQTSMASLMSQTRSLDKPGVEYVTRDEFAAFQKNLTHRLGFPSGSESTQRG